MLIFKKIPLKRKLIIAVVLSIIALGVVAKTGVDNYRQKQYQIQARKSVELSRKQEEEKRKAEEAKKQKEEQEKKEQLAASLEEKYKEAYTAFNNKDYKKAISISDEILAADSNHYKAYTVKGIAYCFTKRFKEGLGSIDKALEIKPDFGYARYNKALAYELFGHYDEALTWYDKALEVENYIWSYYGKASIYGRKGDTINAVKFLKTAIEMNPICKELAREEADFANVRSSKEFQDLIK